MSAPMPPTGPGTGRAARPSVPTGGRSRLPVILALGAAAGAGYYLLNPGAAERDSKKIKDESQAYGNKFDNAVDSAVRQAKSYGQDASKDLKQSYEDVKTKAGNLADDASTEARKAFADAKAEVSKGKEDAKAEVSKSKRGWFS